MKLRAEEELEKAYELDDRIDEVSKQRLSISLRTEKSALSSEDASELLGRMNLTNTSATMIERLGIKNTIKAEIKDLERKEIEHYEAVAGQTEAVQNFHLAQSALNSAAQDVKDAVGEEAAAREALEAAQKRVQSTKQNVHDLRKSFTKIRAIEKKATDTVEATSLCLSKKQEKVRLSLLNREEALMAQIVKDDIENVGREDTKASILHNDTSIAMKEIEDLRKQERFLQAERTRREERASKMVRKAKALKSQADEIERTKGRTNSESAL